MSNIFDDVKLVPGSSSLLDVGVLPVSSRGSLPTINDRYTVESLVNSGVLQVEAEQFIEKFGTAMVKKGCLHSMPKLINTILGRETVVIRTPREKSSSEDEPDSKIQLPVEKLPVQYPEWSTTKVNSPNVFTMHGISSTGKGTRLSQLLHFLDSKYELVTLFANLGKATPIGVYVKDLNLVILGKWVRSNKVGKMISFSSYDWLQGIKTNDGRNFFEVVNRLISEFNVANVAFEGYPCMVDYRHVHNLIPNSKSFACYFSYPQDGGFEILQSRVVGRSGKRIKGTCWGGNIGTHRTAAGHQEKINTGIFPNDVAKDLMYDAPVTSFGEVVLNAISPELVQEFITFSESSNTLRHLDNREESIYKVNRYYIEQQSRQRSGVNIDV